MPKAFAKTSSSIHEAIATTCPWTYTNFGNHSEIEAFIEATGAWETIAEVHSIADLDAEDIADFIVRAVSSYAHREIKN